MIPRCYALVGMFFHLNENNFVSWNSVAARDVAHSLLSTYFVSTHRRRVEQL